MKKRSRKILWLIRHAEAVDAEIFSGDDLDRPLTLRGQRSADKVFKKLSRLRPCPGMVISSKAVRARETAEIFCRNFGIKTFKEYEQLNPGCRFKDMKRVIKEIPAKIDFAVLIGHEPDFSEAVSRFTSGGELSLILKKGGIVELEFSETETIRLSMVIPPDILA